MATSMIRFLHRWRSSAILCSLLRSSPFTTFTSSRHLVVPGCPRLLLPSLMPSKRFITMASTTAQEVLDFYFDPEVLSNNLHFKKNEEFDKKIIAKFTDLHTKANAGELESWMGDAKSALALVILLDQFSRNMFRGSSKSFASDALGLRYAKMMVEKGFDKQIDMSMRAFVYMAYMHSENLEDQKTCVQLFNIPGYEGNFKFAKMHQIPIEKFGRFPHRNEVLGRTSTPEELEYLKEHGGF